ncbi:D-alanyl-D-alanine dipeptidase [Pigmentiphaga litoralis]|uniref:M15 family metallopeptidase n=1 Tax=Pigmentiphaga litoralis TaxID=516702 RepID=UPI001672D039|nr:M15 family metallopeptidase [Pigmentiphaga litoralis]GGX16986.1 D-alanyl-D-alanine dipeptidase [Pigmentiphaga litoralis]
MTRSSSTAGACLAAATLLTSMATTTPLMAQPGPELSIPAGFVHLTDVAQTIPLDVRYHGSNNFLGRPVRGYHAPTCILTLPAAHRLRDIQRELRPSGLSLKVFDCYRPQQAVDDFIAWAKDPADQKAKAAYYPNVPKDLLFERGFIAERSGHSRGSTVDLTLAVLPPGALAEAPRSDAIDKPPVALPTRGALLPNGEVDMGTPFDLFDVQSHTDNPDLPEEVRHNRKFLATLMLKHGFTGVQEEWWHFTLLDEPYPDTYFNFPVR